MARFYFRDDYLKEEEITMENQTLSTRKLILIALLGTIDAVLMSFDMAIPFIPSFIKLDLSEIPVIVAGLSMGFWPGMITAFMKVFIKFILKGTSTAFIGEAVNLAISFYYLLPFKLLLKKDKSNKNIIIAMIVATLISAVLTTYTNYLVVFPMYGRMYGMSSEVILNMFKAANPLVKNSVTMLFCSLVPFNVIKYGLASCLAYLLYQRIPQFREMH